MCSGLRSSSANGAIALRQSAACSWSTSSSSDLSDCTIRGPLVTCGVYGLAAGEASSRYAAQPALPTANWTREVQVHRHPLMKPHGATSTDRRDTGDPVHREGAYVVSGAVVRGELPALDRDRVDHAFPDHALVVGEGDDDGGMPLDGVPEGRERTGGGHRRGWPDPGGGVAGT